MPSVGEETAGLAAIEQLMRGRLVIVSEIAGLAEITGDYGLKFRTGDAQELAARMKSVIENPSMIQEFGERGRVHARKKFARPLMIHEHAKIYQDVASR
jgi:glycosyltransferase involved in cell wall biosynthesis